MGKAKVAWFCTECGFSQPKWSGQCSGCLAWNTLQEEVIEKSDRSKYHAEELSPSQVVPLDKVSITPLKRYETSLKEFNRLLGGGIVPGSLSLVGGDPGIGKSTLMLQVGAELACQNLKVLYISGEESIEQTSIRAHRLGLFSDNLYVVSELNFSILKRHIETLSPQILIVDSIQILYKEELTSAPGSVSQVRELATEFMHLAKRQQIATFLIGHVTKSGDFAGPKVLEHLVDAVFYFEGDKDQYLRLLRCVKNRFGAASEVGLFQMEATGLQEVANLSQMFLEERHTKVPGSIISPTVEGSRPILIEIQSLVTETVFNNPSRKVTGLDVNRLALLIAVLEKRLGYPLYRYDIFVSIVGGLKITEPALDLAVLLAMASSYVNRCLDPDIVALGEVGLAGELRSIPKVEERIKEAIAMGFNRVILPKRCLKSIDKNIKNAIELVGVDRVEEAIDTLI